MVIVVVEPGAVADAVSVTVAEHVGLQLAGVNALAETPVGSTVVMLKVTAVVTPATNVVDAVSTPPAAPPTIVRVEGVAARLKSKPAGVTTKLNVAVRLTPPPTAWLVIVVVEPGAVADAVKVTVAEQVGLQLAGVNALAVTPVGRTVVILKVAAVVTPATSVADAVSTPPAPPPTIVSVAGVAARLKSNAAGVTTRLNVAVLVKVTVAEHVGLQLAGVNALAVTPVGRAVVMLKVTAVVTPATRVAVAVSTPPAAPPTIVKVAGVAARLKSKPAGVTTKLKVAVRVTPPPTAWIVIVVVEAGAVADAVKVTVAEHVGLQLAGVKALAVTPAGRAVRMLNVTGVVVPETSVAVAVSTPPAPPPVIDRVAGAAAKLNEKAPPPTVTGTVADSWILEGATVADPAS